MRKIRQIVKRMALLSKYKFLAYQSCPKWWCYHAKSVQVALCMELKNRELIIFSWRSIFRRKKAIFPWKSVNFPGRPLHRFWKIANWLFIADAPQFYAEKSDFSRKFVNFLGRSLHGVCRENSQISRDVLCMEFEELLIDYFFREHLKHF